MKPAPLIFAFVFLFPLAFSSSDIVFPWESQDWIASNPGIVFLDGQYIWSSGYFEPSLDSLALDRIDRSGFSQDADMLFSTARAARVEATYADAACQTALETWRSRQEGLNATAAERLFYFMTWSIPAGPAGGVTGSLSPEIIYILQSIFSPLDFSPCQEYGTHWKRTVQSSFEALALVEASMKKSRAGLATAVSTATFAGLCDTNYTGSGARECREVASDLEYINANSPVGGLSPVVLFTTEYGASQDALYSSRPDFSSYSRAFAHAQDAQRALDSHFLLITEGMEEAKSGLSNEHRKTESLAFLLDQKIKALSTDRTSLVVISGGSSDVPVKERFDNVIMLHEQVQSKLDQAAEIESQRERHYLSYAYLLLIGTQEDLESSLAEAEEISADLDLLIEEHETTAGLLEERFIAHAQTINTPEYEKISSQSALSILRAREATLPRGERIQLYRTSIALLNRGLETSQPTDSDVSSLISRSQSVRVLLDRAAIDGLEITSLESQFEAASNPTIPESGIIFDRLAEEVVLLARIQYGDLSHRHEFLTARVARGGSATEDLAAMLSETDPYFDEDHLIILPLAVGQLGEIDSILDDVEQGLAQNFADLVSGGIVVEVVEDVPLFELDAPTSRRLLLSVINTQDTTGSNVRVFVPLSYETPWLTQDIVVGRELVSLVESGDGLYITLKNVVPYGIIDLSLEHNSILAHTLRNTLITEGSFDGTATSIQTTEFDLDLPARFSQGNDNVHIDGGSSTRILAPGKHQLIHRSFVNDGYALTISEPRTEVGMSDATISFEATIQPSIDLSIARVRFALPVGAHDIIILSKSGHTTTKILNEGDSISTIVSDVSVSRPAILLVQYKIPSSRASIDGQASEILSRTNRSDTKILVSQALAAPTEKEALSLLAKARTELIKEEQDSFHDAIAYAQLNESYQKEKVRLLSVLSSLESLGDVPLVRALRERISEIDHAASLSVSQGLVAYELLEPAWEKTQVKTVLRQSQAVLSDAKKTVRTNTINPLSILPVEEAIRALEVSGKIEDVPPILLGLDDLSTLLSSKQGSTSQASFEAYLALKTNYEMQERFYETACNSLRDTSFRSLCTLDPSAARKLLRDLETAHETDASDSEISQRMNAAKKSTERFTQFQNDLKELASKHAANAQSLFDSRSTRLSSEDRTRIAAMLSQVQSLISQGNQADALIKSALATEEIKRAKQDDSGLIMLALGALIVLGIVAYFLLNAKKGDPPVTKLKRIARAHEN